MKALLGKQILIVDDEPLIREILAAELRSLGAATFEAANGTLAFEFLQGRPIDLLISDVRMPDGDGVTLLKRVQNDLESKPKVFLCSGFNDITADEAAKLNVIEILSKPFNLRKVLDQISELFADHQ